MNMKEAIQKREALLAEQRQINQAMKILDSESIPKNPGIAYAKINYSDRLKEIDKEIRALADQVTEDVEDKKGEYTVKFDFQGTIAYPTGAVVKVLQEPVLPDDVLTWSSKEDAEAFARWYAGKYSYEVVPVSSLGF